MHPHLAVQSQAFRLSTSRILPAQSFCANFMAFSRCEHAINAPAAQVCQAVQAMHSQPECLIHRDIKVCTGATSLHQPPLQSLILCIMPCSPCCAFSVPRPPTPSPVAQGSKSGSHSLRLIHIKWRLSSPPLLVQLGPSKLRSAVPHTLHAHPLIALLVPDAVQRTSAAPHELCRSAELPTWVPGEIRGTCTGTPSPA